MKILKFSLPAALLLLSLPGFSQKKAATHELIIPLDPAVKTGRLPNGIQYFIRRNTEPSGRVIMYLANKVGSILETDSQRGLAHFLEHMNFNGTTHFPKNELVNYLQKSGVRFGADLNAYTAFDETVYKLPIPSDDSVLLKQGFQIMRDWAKGALLEESEIDKERGVILEEKRLRNGLDERIQTQTLPLMFNHSRYAERMPIGTDEVLNHFSYKEIRSFYEDWYRPDLQGIIIVGDIDVDKTEREIKHLFADLKSPVKSRKREQYTIPLTGENHFLAVTDQEMTGAYLRVLHKIPVHTVCTVQDYRSELVGMFYERMISARLAEVARKADPQFVKADNGFENLYDNLEAFAVNIVLKPGKIENGVRAAYSEIERVKRFGFTDTELNRVKDAYLKGMKARYLEKDKQKSLTYADQYLDYFLGKAPAPGTDYYYKMAQEIVPGIQLKDVNGIVAQYMKDVNRDIFVIAPASWKEQLPDEATLLSWIASVKKRELSAYVEETNTNSLLITIPPAGSIIKKSTDQVLGTTTLVLSNGVTVVLKPTTFNNNQIRMYAYSPGGTSLYPDADFESASNAAAFVRSGGLGNFNPTQLRNYLSGKNVQVIPYISDRYEGLSGVSGRDDLPAAFELVHAYFTSPRIDKDFFAASIAQARTNVLNSRNNPEAVFADTVNKILYKDNIRKTAITLPRIDKINADRALGIYKERFADATDFVFTFVGSFTVEEIEPLLMRYLANLPANGRKETAPDLGLYPPAKGVTETIKLGKADKATVIIAYVGKYAYSQQDNLLLEALSECLQIRLVQRLREEDGGIYTVNVSPATYKYPQSRFSLNISFVTAPGKTEKLIASVKDEVRKLRENGPSEENVNKFIAEEQRTMELSLKDNGFWLDRLVYAGRDNEDISGLLRYNEQLKSVTVGRIREIAGKYFNDNSLFIFTHLPEGEK